MIGSALAGLSLALAMVPFALYWRNLRRYRPPPGVGGSTGEPAAGRPRVSVLIPARDEERSIGAAVESVLESESVDVELLVFDDGSRDATRSIVERIAERDPRVRLIVGPTLPDGWCGKQHACWTLSKCARHERLVFLDADVRVAPDGIARTLAFLEESGADLASGIPRQVCGTSLERLLVPLIHFLLLGFLPLHRMRRSAHPAYAAGCGQLFAARRPAYERAGGHAAIRASLHDGLTLPAAFRRAGCATDLFDATPVASCRMYRGAREVWKGLGKNAREGLAHPKRIVPATLLLAGSQVLPPALLAWAWVDPPAAGGAPTTVLSALGSLAVYLPRLDASRRFAHSRLGVWLHPAGVSLFLALQWHALLRQLAGSPAHWKGRTYPEVPTGDDVARVSGP